MDIFMELNTITAVSSHTKPTQTRLWCVCKACTHDWGVKQA